MNKKKDIKIIIDGQEVKTCGDVVLSMSAKDIMGRLSTLASIATAEYDVANNTINMTYVETK